MIQSSAVWTSRSQDFFFTLSPPPLSLRSRLPPVRRLTGSAGYRPAPAVPEQPRGCRPCRRRGRVRGPGAAALPPPPLGCVAFGSPAALRGAPPARPGPARQPLPSDSGAARPLAARRGGPGEPVTFPAPGSSASARGEEEEEQEEQERTQVQAIISRGKERNSDRSSSRATITRTPLSSSSS